VNYRESISKTADVRYVHKKQSGGSGQFADVAIRFEPGEPGTGFVFKSDIKGGTVPKEYIPGVVKVSQLSDFHANSAKQTAQTSAQTCSRCCCIVVHSLAAECLDCHDQYAMYNCFNSHLPLSRTQLLCMLSSMSDACTSHDTLHV